MQLARMYAAVDIYVGQTENFGPVDLPVNELTGEGTGNNCNLYQ